MDSMTEVESEVIDMTEVESEVIDMDDIEEGEKEACLLGRLVTKKNRNPSKLIEALTKAWKPKHGMSSRVWGESKLILFRFDDAIERDWVLKNQPWFFKGTLFAIEKFAGENEQQLSPSVNVTVEHASFWARLYDVPFSCMNERSLRHIAKQIGVLESLDISGEDLIGKFIRFKVSMNITKPLLRGITIRVKGKHLWLPLKYESLPIYCFSCGTIGHDYNCQSYNRNLKYSILKIEEHNDTQTALPRNIVENIISRLPVKHLLRFKSVCKQWKATISDPRFAEIHLQQYKNSSSRNLLAWEQLYKGLYVAEIQNKDFQFESVIQHSREYNSSWEYGFLCTCDGLYLKFSNTSDEGKMYVLWNPSCRVDHEIWCPQPIDDRETETTLYGIYYNPLMKDYKVVIADLKQYAVFSCRYNKWSEVKEMKDICTIKGASWDRGVSFNGSFHWLMSSYERVEEVVYYDCEIIYFDGKVEKFKKLPMPDCKKRTDCFYLTCSGSHLYLFVEVAEPGDHCNDMRFWKNVGGEKDLWIEFKMQLGFCSTYFTRPIICCVNEDEFMLDCDNKLYYCLYRQSENTLSRLRKYNDPVIYRENLFLQ